MTQAFLVLAFILLMFLGLILFSDKLQKKVFEHKFIFGFNFIFGFIVFWFYVFFRTENSLQHLMGLALLSAISLAILTAIHFLDNKFKIHKASIHVSGLFLTITASALVIILYFCYELLIFFNFI
jgi:hypothetical protein